MVFKNFKVLVLWMKVVSALEGLKKYRYCILDILKVPIPNCKNPDDWSTALVINYLYIMLYIF